jgi:SAM-dependent methyltransferase
MNCGIDARRQSARPTAITWNAVSSTQERCPVCDVPLDIEALPAVVVRLPRSRWVKCPACHSFFAAETYDAEREARDGRTKTWGGIESGIALGRAKQPMFDAILRVLRSAAPPGGSLLDVGCSYGSFMERARDAGYQVRGVDLLPDAVDYVRNRGLVCDRAASVRDLNIADDSQDVVSVLDCNYYWPNQRHELRAIWKRLRPGGLLAMR